MNMNREHMDWMAEYADALWGDLEHPSEKSQAKNLRALRKKKLKKIWLNECNTESIDGVVKQT